MDADRKTVRRLSRGDADEVTRVLCDAFAGYPVMRHVLGDTAEAGPRLERLIGLFVMARALRGEPMFGIGPTGQLMAAAIVSYPGRGMTPPEFGRLRDAVFTELGTDTLARYEAYGEATRPFEMPEPHIHLNMIGVRRHRHGTGLGRLLIEEVHRLSAADPDSTGVTLTTENPANVPFYEHLGYRIIGHARVAPGLETWGFFRPD